MTPKTSPARPSLLAVVGILAVTCAVAATCAASPADAASPANAWRVGVRASTHGRAVRVAATHRGGGHAAGERRWAGQQVTAHPGELTETGQVRALRYWTAARMARARPPGISRDPGIAPASAATAHLPAAVIAAAGRKARSAAVLAHTATAAWPRGGVVARSTGKVFFTMDAHDYVCSAAVVASANADVVITAAHCVKNGTGSWARNWMFVPGFTQGSRPYGTWTARHFFVARQWSHGANDNDDVAFVTLNPRHAGGRIVHIAHLVGGDAIRFGRPTAEEFLFGYPAEPPYDGGGLYYCSGRIRPDAFHASPDRGLSCVLTAGSSGGPWLSGFNPATGIGTITSVSSFKYSSDPSTLYGTPLGVIAQALFNRAQHR